MHTLTIPRLRPAALAVGLASCLALAVALEGDARACGGCFHAGSDVGTSFVTDHRMVLSISKQQTVLWDQVQYTGDPKEFAWVLPVRDGARIELARDEWIRALDVSTRVSVKGPDVSCNGTAPASSGTAGAGGGGCGGSTESVAYGGAGGPGGVFAGDAGSGDPDVTVIGQSVVGPYQAVTLRSSKGDALDRWLDANGFVVPNDIVPIISAYAREGFDFIALKLRPGVGTRSMRPVRVVTPGASPVLPLRMVTAGIGARVGITLFVVSEGRYRAANFPDVAVDAGKLAWDGRANRSNYPELVTSALAGSPGGRGWITEHATRASAMIGAQALYGQACFFAPPITVPCDSDGGTPLPPGDAGATPSDAGDPDASSDAGSSAEPDAGCTTTKPACVEFDDATVALRGMQLQDVWVTKLRSSLGATDCAAGDLQLGAAPEQQQVSGRYTTSTFTDPSFDPCPNDPKGGSSSGGSTSSGCVCDTTHASSLPPIGLAVLGAGVVVALRRRRR